MSPEEAVQALGPRLVMLHWLGGSARTWNEVVSGLVGLGVRPAARDLPGFGFAAAANDFTLNTMVADVVAAIQTLRVGEEDTPWFIAGHSMGGKVAACVARAAADGTEGLQNLAGIVLISPSPPGPEPMEESKRKELLNTLGKRTGTALDTSYAKKFVDDNTGKAELDAPVQARAVEDVLRSSESAFAAWLNTGSEEDVGSRVGTITVPVLLLAGTEDAALGPDAQRKHTLPHCAAAHVVVLEGCGHLAPLERPVEVVKVIADFVEQQGIVLARAKAPLGAQFESLIASDRTSPQTRARLEGRLRDPQPVDPHLLTGNERMILVCLCARVIPGCGVDLVRRVQTWIASSKHDGWRNDQLPNDLEAWRVGLHSLDAAARRAHSVGFAALTPVEQDTLLSQASEGSLGKGLLGNLHLGDSADCLNAEQMRAWFEDVRGELTRMYVADPRTMERMGFTGFADEKGFTRIRLGEREEFER